jgi:4-amino-4-deoxy-L-arabinose transferase-like glycosyltransferase
MQKKGAWLFLLVLALVIRLPFFLTRGEPGGDEIIYFGQSLSIFRVADLSGYHVYGNYYGKIFFVLLQAPFSSLVFLLTGNVTLSASFFPFISSLLFIILYYYFVKKLYGEVTAYWAGLIMACLPFMVYYSASMLSHTFFIYIFILGCLFLLKHLEDRKYLSLLVACFILAFLCKIRVEGFVIYLLAAIVVFYETWKTGTEVNDYRKKVLSTGLILVSVPLLISVSSELLTVYFFGPPDRSFQNFAAGKALGFLSYKLSTMFGVKFPGGFLKSNKLDYLLENYHLVPYVLLIVFYDTMKTLFVIPARLIPPLLFIFLGVVLAGKAEKKSRQVQVIERICLLSLLTVLIYPLLMFLSHSRYIYIYVPVLVLFIAKGLKVVEDFVSEKLAWKKKQFSSKMLLTILVLLYFSTFYFIMLVPIFKNWNSIKATNIVAETIQKDFGLKKMPIMSMIGLPFDRNHDVLYFPYKISNREGVWGYWTPVSLEETVGILKKREEALLILSRKMVSGESAAPETPRDYFAESFSRDLGFDDEGLELMRPKNAASKDLYSEFRPIITGEETVPGLSLVRILPDLASGDSIYIFRYQEPKF